jgi:hypothetical protein
MQSNKHKLIFQIIEDSINKLIIFFKKYPDIFLTEEDARCFLYSILIEDETLKKLYKTSDDSYSIPVHTEVRWYGYDDNKLKYRSDIVVIDPTDLQTKNNQFFEVN